MLKANTPAGHIAVEGQHDHLSRRVDIATGEVIDYQPPSPSPVHEWNAETKRWALSAVAQAKIDGHAAALGRIVQLEVAQHRALREFTLRGDPDIKARLQAIDDEIDSLRPHLG